MKPILKIELPATMNQEDAKNVWESLTGGAVEKDYHILIIVGNSEFLNVEIVTAGDINLHLNK